MFVQGFRRGRCPYQLKRMLRRMSERQKTNILLEISHSLFLVASGNTSYYDESKDVLRVLNFEDDLFEE